LLSKLTQWAHEDVWGWLLLTISLTCLYRLLRQSEPIKLLAAGYVVQAFCWIYLCAYMLKTMYEGLPVRPAFVAMSCIVALIAFLSLVCKTRPRRRYNLPDHPSRRASDVAP
jgi:hypothetical protein